MKRLIDTLVLVGAINPKDDLHQDALRHLQSASSDSETLLPLSSAFEFDLVLKERGYTDDERADALDWLASSIPPSKVECNFLSSLGDAVKLQKRGMGYFDSLISSLALAMDAVVVTTDKQISKVARTDW